MANKYRPRSSRAMAWETMRAMRSFTVPDLCQITGARESNVKRFVRVLELAGYLSKRRVRAPGACFEYKLIRDTGFKSPVQKTIRSLWDPNNDEYWIENSSRQVSKEQQRERKHGADQGSE